MIDAAIDWTNVLVALIFTVPSIIAALASLSIHRKVKTPSGTSIGKQVENVLHTSLANNYRLRSIGGAVDAADSPAAHRETAQVDNLPEGNDEPPNEGGTQ